MKNPYELDVLNKSRHKTNKNIKPYILFFEKHTLTYYKHPLVSCYVLPIHFHLINPINPTKTESSKT